MLTPEEQATLDRNFRVISIIWGTLLFSLGLYILVGYLVIDSINLAANADIPVDILTNALIAVSAISLIAAFVLRKRLLNPVSLPDSSQAGFICNVHPAAMKYQSATIISAALCESVGIYGLVLFFMSKDFNRLYGFIAVAAAAMLFFRPSKEDLYDLARDMASMKQY